MVSKILNYLKKSKFLTKVAAVLSLFAISSSAVEARVPKSSPTTRTSVKKRVQIRKVSPRRARAYKSAPVRARAVKARVVKARVARPTKTQSVKQVRQKQQRVVSARAASPVSRGKRAQQVKLGRSTRAQIAAAQQAAIQQNIARVAAEQAAIRQAADRVAAAHEVTRQALARAAAEQEALHQAALRFAAEQERLNRFENRPFVRQEGFRMTGDSRAGIDMNESNYIRCDLGYEGRGRARTQQYEILHLPTAPVLHPYFPANELAMKGYDTPAFTLNVRLPGYRADFGPEALRQNLVGVNPEIIDMFCVVQDMPWYDDLRPGPEDDALRLEPGLAGQLRRYVQLKPQYWLEPNAPNNSAEDYNAANHTYVVRTGVFSAQRPAVQIQGQPAGGLLEEPGISVHNSGPGTDLVSSGNVLPIENLDLNTSQILYSLTKKIGAGGVVERVAIVQHVLLNQADEPIFEGLLQGSRNLKEVEEGVRAARVGGHFVDLNLEEVKF